MDAKSSTNMHYGSSCLLLVQHTSHHGTHLELWCDKVPFLWFWTWRIRIIVFSCFSCFRVSRHFLLLPDVSAWTSSSGGCKWWSSRLWSISPNLSFFSASTTSSWTYYRESFADIRTTFEYTFFFLVSAQITTSNSVGWVWMLRDTGIVRR